MRWPFRKRGETPQPEVRPVEKAPVRRGFKLSAMQAAAAPVGQADPVNPFTPYEPAPIFGRAPAKAATMAMDDAGAAFTATMNWGMLDAAYEEGLVFVGYPALSNWSQRAEYRRPAEIIAREMTRKWLRIQASGDEDLSEKVEAIEAEFERLQVRDKFREALEHDGFFGRAHIVPDFGNLSPEELKTPLALTPAKIKKGSLKALRVVEPLWTYPGLYNTTNPLAEDFYRPTSWLVMSQEVHASRLLTIISREVPDMLKPAYSFGGLPLLQLMKPYIDNWLSTRQSVNDLIQSFTVWGLAADLSSLTQASGTDADLVSRAQLFNQMRDNRGMFLIDKGSEEFFNVTTSLANLDKLQAQAQEHMSAACGIPLIKLFGIVPSGLNSDGGTAELANFHETLESQQHDLDPQVKALLAMVQLNLYGEVDPAITHVWEPLRHLDEAELANVRKVNADTAAVLIDCGVLDPSEPRKALAAEVGGPYSGIGVDDMPDRPEPPADPNASPDEPNPVANPNPTQDDPT